jgi:Heparinase II/III-like protein/Heparinase II/III N-terminus
MTLAKIGRLRTMSLGELAGRGQQAATRWLDRAGLSFPPDAPAEARSAERFWRAAPARFFPGPTNPATVRLVAWHAPEHCRAVVRLADKISARRFDLLGYHDLDFGDPPDWRLDPVSGRRAPLTHWSRIDPLDASEIGDSKVIWELSRHQWGVTLGQAYRLTGERRYAETFVSLVTDWCRANPRGRGINWASSLEVALRAIAWCWALQLFGPSAPVPEPFVAELLGVMWLSAVHVERYLSTYFSPNTHLTGEALGLVYAGVAFGDAPRAARWRTLGTQILIDQSRRQIHADGVYFEQSTYYQRYTADIYLHLLLLARQNAIVVPPALHDRIQGVLDFLLAVRRGGGSLPLVGDADGGSLVPLARRQPDDLRGVFGVAAAHYGRADYAWAADGLTPEALWLVGPEAVDVITRLESRPPRAPASRVFPDGGYAVMRSGWESDAHCLVFDTGPLGCPVSGAHGHADLLSVECSVFGAPCVVDPGTGCYTTDHRWRNFFRSTGAHSTVVVDGIDQAEPVAPFAWRSRPRARVLRWRSDARLDLAEAEHDAYARLTDPVRHRRKVLFVKPRLWIVVDDLLGLAEHRIDVRFQFAPMTLRIDPGQWVRALAGDGRGLLVRAVSRVPLKLEIHDGDLDPICGWVSRDYGQRAPAPMLVYSTTASLPLRIVTMLVPFAGSPSAVTAEHREEA